MRTMCVVLALECTATPQLFAPLLTARWAENEFDELAVSLELLQTLSFSLISLKVEGLFHYCAYASRHILVPSIFTHPPTCSQPYIVFPFS